MSTVDDLLFAPINQAQPVTGSDFLVRSNEIYDSYDWKPLTDRAHQWARRNMTRAYLKGQQDTEGWILHVSSEPGPPDDSPAPWIKELFTGNYTFEFEEIPTP